MGGGSDTQEWAALQRRGWLTPAPCCCCCACRCSSLRPPQGIELENPNARLGDLDQKVCGGAGAGTLCDGSRGAYACGSSQGRLQPHACKRVTGVHLVWVEWKGVHQTRVQIAARAPSAHQRLHCPPPPRHCCTGRHRLVLFSLWRLPLHWGVVGGQKVAAVVGGRQRAAAGGQAGRGVGGPPHCLGGCDAE
jgi:hypothetical protein